MLWRGSARLGGVSGVDFNVFGNPAELVRKLEMYANIAVFVDLDVVYQVRENFTGQRFDGLILCKSYQRGVFLVNAVQELRPFRIQPGQHIRKLGGLPFIIGFHIPVFLLGDFPVFPILIQALFIAGDFRQFLFLCGYLVVQAVGLTFFQRGRIDTGYQLRVGNGGVHLILDSEQNGGL